MNELQQDHSTGRNDSYITHDLIENVYVRYCVAGIQILAILLAIIGNAYVIYCIKSHKRFRQNVAAYLVLNLAFCDLFNAVVAHPMLLVDIILPFSQEYRQLFQDSIYCKTIGFFVSFTSAATFHTILAISQERLLLICYPFKAKNWLTVKKIKILLCFIWLTSFCATVPIPVYFTFVQTFHLQETDVTCCFSIVLDDSINGRIYFIFLFSAYFTIPMVAIFISYTRIFCTLSRNMHGVKRQDESIRKVMQSRKSLAKLMMTIAILFAVSNGPYFCTFLYVSFGGVIETNPLFAMLMLQMLPILSSSLNPIIYSTRARHTDSNMLNFLQPSVVEDRSQKSDVSLKSVKKSTRNSTSSQSSKRNGSGKTAWIEIPPNGSAAQPVCV